MCRLSTRLVVSTAYWGSLAIRLAHASRRVEHVVGFAHVVDETDLVGAFGADAVARERELLGQQQARVQRPRDRPTIGGDEADDDVRVGEVRRAAHEHHVGERDEAATQARPPAR